MTQEHTDLRVKRTNTALREALIDLITEKGFDAVTVGDISERAMVNRATFYRHYQDKYDLVTSIFRGAVDTLVAELDVPDSLDAMHQLVIGFISAASASPTSPEVESAQHAWTGFFEHFARHDRLYRAMLGKRGSAWFTAKMVEYIADSLYRRTQASTLWPQLVAAELEDMPLDVRLAWIANWLVSILAWWLDAGTAYSSWQVANWSKRIMVGGLFNASGFVPVWGANGKT